MPTRRIVLGGIAVTTATIAGCVGGDGGGPGVGEDTTTPSGDGSDATVTVAETALGEVLADSEGMTLYLFTQDSDGESVCYDDCEENWPPLTVDDEPTAGEGVTTELSTHERDDGATQVVANGWPLYFFAGDSAPGDTSGQGVGDVWYVLAPDGSQMGGSGATTTTTENGGGGSMY